MSAARTLNLELVVRIVIHILCGGGGQLIYILEASCDTYWLLADILPYTISTTRIINNTNCHSVLNLQCPYDIIEVMTSWCNMLG